MTAGEQNAGVATEGRPRTTRRVDYEPAPTVCVCGTEQPNHCPQNCLIREDAQR